MTEEKVLYHATACFPLKDGKVLLAKKTKKIGEGCWNGYGGGIEEGETQIACAVRELKEESGIIARPADLEKIAIANFHNTTTNGQTFVCQVHIYLVYAWEGEPQETQEMITPTWFSIDALPLEDLIPSDPAWLPIALSGQKIIVTAHLGPFQKELLGEVEIQRVTELPHD